MSRLSNPHTDTQSESPISYLSDWRMADSIGTAVVLSVADHTDRTPTELPQLSRAVDPDALDRLLDGPQKSVSVTFSYAGCELSLKGDGELVIQ